MTNKTQREFWTVAAPLVPQDKIGDLFDAISKVGKKAKEASVQSAPEQLLSALPVLSPLTKDEGWKMGDGVFVINGKTAFVRIEGFKTSKYGISRKDAIEAQQRLYNGLVDEDGWIVNPEGEHHLTIHANMVKVLEQKVPAFLEQVE